MKQTILENIRIGDILYVKSKLEPDVWWIVIITDMRIDKPNYYFEEYRRGLILGCSWADGADVSGAFDSANYEYYRIN